MASASGTMEGVSTTGSSGLIFDVDVSSGETTGFVLSNRGSGGEGATRTACEDFVSLFICFAKKDTATGQVFDPILSTYVVEVERSIDVPFPYFARDARESSPSFARVSFLFSIRDGNS